MSNGSTQSKKDKNKSSKKGWFWRTWIEGTVAEPWPTAKEILEDEEIQQKIAKVRKVVNGVLDSQKK